MRVSKKVAIIYLIIIIVIAIPIHIWLGIFFNNKLFHKDAIEETEGHYEPKVYITPTGECYHSPDCSYIKRMQAIDIFQAKQKGYRVCSHCDGIPYNEIYIEGNPAIPEKNNYFASFILSFVLIGTISIFLFIAIAYKNDSSN